MHNVQCSNALWQNRYCVHHSSGSPTDLKVVGRATWQVPKLILWVFCWSTFPWECKTKPLCGWFVGKTEVGQGRRRDNSPALVDIVCFQTSIFLDAIAFPSTYPCQSVGQWLSESVIVSYLEIAIASPSFATFWYLHSGPQQLLQNHNIMINAT